MQPKRTYGSQNRREITSFILNSSDTSSSPERGGSDFFSLKRKRPLMDLLSNTTPPLKKPATVFKKAKLNDKNGRHSAAKTKTGLRQMHLAIETSVIKTCSICNLSYTIGAPDDESLHRSHCARVQRGMEWGKEEEKELGMSDTDAFIVEDDIILSSKEKGRIVAVRANVGKKLGAKVCTYGRMGETPTDLSLADFHILKDSKRSAISTRLTYRGAFFLQGLYVPATRIRKQAREDSWRGHCSADFHSHADSQLRRRRVI